MIFLMAVPAIIDVLERDDFILIDVVKRDEPLPIRPTENELVENPLLVKAGAFLALCVHDYMTGRIENLPRNFRFGHSGSAVHVRAGMQREVHAEIKLGHDFLSLHVSLLASAVRTMRRNGPPVKLAATLP